MSGIAQAEKRVIGFLVAKGLLYDPKAEPMPMVKLTPKEVLAVAEQVEPRVYEVIPAAIIHFPRSFLDIAKYPNDIQEVIKAVKAGVSEHASLRGLPYKNIKRWADLPLQDKRTRPASKKKVMRAYRLRPAVLSKLSQLARNEGISETETIERLIEAAVK